MNFENLEIHVSDLPDFKTVDLTPVQKRYKKLMWLNESFIFIILFALPVTAFFFDDISTWIPTLGFSVICIIFILRGVEIEKGFPIKKFGIRQHDMIYQSGFFYFKERHFNP